MDTTPKAKLRLSTKAKKDVKNGGNNSAALQSPVRKTVQREGDSDYSPIFFPSTQESNDDIDVLWDWHSPQTSQKKRKKQKRLLPSQSPKIPLRRFPSNNQSQNFEKLKNELKALQEELAMPDESWLSVSPQEECDFKSSLNSKIVVEPESLFDDDDLFNDSFDEQLVLFTQQIEGELLNKEKVEPSDKKSEQSTETDNVVNKHTAKQENVNLSQPTKICDSEVDNIINKYVTKKDNELNLSDSFFEDVVSDLAFDDLQQNSSPNQSKVPFQRTRSENCFNKTTQNVIQTASGKLEFNRTRSFEMTRETKCTEEEIERKRLEALAKRNSKKRQESSAPIKCSPEEIERKRLEAMAKLQAKKMQDVIEKKRQEALKKLQMRKQNACHVKSTLATRL
ncbi:uncharacterized protein LOC103313612 [Tribolium castaneum]|uniref:Uncharacterized protein n=1 Tax=Tribolium castaneum TaxID=7070 RepID=A0A139WFP0_TRICA|nr:PREDICTED: uncharacterized protein LOC103313612 [Tribolium castaneum]KYB26734.1 hypothetical protein TcasGA2_TC033646 [Tribolium castaneum]|eukprot:XP_008195522.1 PREDICTED: uncharacterized protein LOC103313612 [Tribolium castaneum]